MLKIRGSFYGNPSRNKKVTRFDSMNLLFYGTFFINANELE